MKSLNQWFVEYGKTHTHPTNKTIHYFCVPLIMYSTLGLLDAVSQKEFLDLKFSLTFPILFLAGLFYIRLRWQLGVAIIFFAALMIASFKFYPSVQFQLIFHLILFIISWIAQFIGHKIEGAKPSFIDDLRFLLIGPLWVVDKLSGRRIDFK